MCFSWCFAGLKVFLLNGLNQCFAGFMVLLLSRFTERIELWRHSEAVQPNDANVGNQTKILIAGVIVVICAKTSRNNKIQSCI